MSLKLRFALLFASLVTLILVISAAVILYLFADNRKKDFTDRLRDEAIQTKKWYTGNHNLVPNSNNGNLINIEKVILDSSYVVQLRYPDTAHISLNYNRLTEIKNRKDFYFEDVEQREGIGLYSSSPSIFIIVTAFDKFGKQKESKLKVSLLMVTFGGMLLSGLFAFFYVSQMGKPLTEINRQIEQLTDVNLSQRLTVPKGYKELQFLAYNFNEMMSRLQRAFDIQKSFVHHASHELRTPLAVMLAQTESALNRDLSPEDAKKVLLSLKEDQQEMIELTNSLLILSQYEKVTFSKDWPLVRIDEIIYDNISMVKRMYPQLNVSLEFGSIPEDDLSLSIRGNDALLRSAVRNLLRNAYTYSSDNQVKITISSDEKTVTLDFENKGNQLNEMEQQQLFLPFFRGQNSVSRKGFGLGLSIVMRIVNMHKGSIHYEAKGKDINRFTLVFPKYT
ncbi:MAG: two-component sensor histidine kinase [Chitinophagaceae bacterium]|nr:two-component sensor histidine kinase [Chitinophagaceae bacterium]